MLDIEVMNDLEEHGGDRQALTKHYLAEMKKILDFHGGNMSDMPIVKDHPYYTWSDKLRLLGNLK